MVIIRLLVMLFAVSVNSRISIGTEERRDIYLVLLEGEAVAFRQGVAPGKDGIKPLLNK